ncbi:MAG: hypothetical protein FWE33_03680 [Defluviitaleaceae bacterium]|nr:hypothetical protein [Defluviitaleaceae bacterium]
MILIIALICEKCNAPLIPKLGANLAKCVHCGTQFITEDKVDAEKTFDVQYHMQAGEMLLKSGKWEIAHKYFNDVASATGYTYAPAYIGMLRAELRLTYEDWLGNHYWSLTAYDNFNKALDIAEGDYRKKLDGYAESVSKKLRKKRIFKILNRVSLITYLLSSATLLYFLYLFSDNILTSVALTVLIMVAPFLSFFLVLKRSRDLRIISLLISIGLPISIVMGFSWLVENAAELDITGYFNQNLLLISVAGMVLSTIIAYFSPQR